MCQAEIFGNQSNVWLIYWCVNRDQGTGMSELPSVWNSLCHSELFNLSHCHFPSPSMCYIHNTAMSPGSEKGTKRQMCDPGQQDWVCLASPSLLTCANQKEHSVLEVQIVLAKWSPKVPVVHWQKPQVWVRNTLTRNPVYQSCLCLKFWWTDLCPWRMSVTVWFTFLEWSLSSHTSSSSFHL